MVGGREANNSDWRLHRISFWAMFVLPAALELQLQMLTAIDVDLVEVDSR